MKRPRKLSVAERQYLKDDMKLATENRMISKRTSDEWLLVHRFTNKTKLVPAP